MMRRRGYFEGAPGYWIQDSRSPDGKRFVSTVYGWGKIRAMLCTLAGERCESKTCTRRTRTTLAEGHGHHVNGRGGRRDDRIWVNGERGLLWFCMQCHDLVHRPAKVVPAKV